MQQCIKILLFHIYVKLSMFRVTHRTVCLTTSTNYTSKQPPTYEKPEAASAVLGSWWWAVCRPKHAELHINME